MALLLSYIRTNYPGSPQWSPADIPDLTGKIALVTGGNTGLGKITVQELLKHNAKVYFTARTKEGAEKAVEELKTLTDGKVAHPIIMDLANLRSVKDAAEAYLRQEQELHILFNNAGVMLSPVEMLTDDGYDLQFGVNVIGHFLLTKLLLPILLSSVSATNDKHVRVITTSSWSHNVYPNIDYATLKGNTPAHKKQGTNNLYNQSKFANILVANELARRYGTQGLVSISVHPGFLNTRLTRHLPRFLARVMAWTSHPAPLGALSQLRAGTSNEGAEWNGKYLVPWAQLGTPHKNTQDEAEATRLWEYLEKQVQKFE